MLPYREGFSDRQLSTTNRTDHRRQPGAASVVVGIKGRYDPAGMVRLAGYPGNVRSKPVDISRCRALMRSI